MQCQKQSQTIMSSQPFESVTTSTRDRFNKMPFRGNCTMDSALVTKKVLLPLADPHSFQDWDFEETEAKRNANVSLSFQLSR